MFRLFFPYMFFLLTYSLYSAWIFEKEDEDSRLKVDNGWIIPDRILKVILLLYSVFFLINEVIQMLKDGLQDYFNDLWNYLDLIPIIILDATLILDWAEYFPEVQRPLLAICSLLLWIKFMYYLRIFRKTSFFISMIIEVFRDIRYFIVILIIICFAFGSCFYIMSN
jgi:hypothetical protein